MAWMMDQLASIGLAFEDETITKIFQDNVCYYFDRGQESKPTSTGSKHKHQTQWAIPSIYEEHKPVRPWALGEFEQPATGFYQLAGKTTRTPGLYRRVDPETSLPTAEFLMNTNEHIHRSVRIRLALQGLGYNDEGLYKCRALLKKGPWELQRMRLVNREELHEEDEMQEQDRWGWTYVGPEEDAPPKQIMMEELLGPYEQRLLHLNKGMPISGSSFGRQPWDPSKACRLLCICYQGTSGLTPVMGSTGRAFYKAIIAGSRRH